MAITFNQHLIKCVHFNLTVFSFYLGDSTVFFRSLIFAWRPQASCLSACVPAKPGETLGAGARVCVSTLPLCRAPGPTHPWPLPCSGPSSRAHRYPNTSLCWRYTMPSTETVTSTHSAQTEHRPGSTPHSCCRNPTQCMAHYHGLLLWAQGHIMSKGHMKQAVQQCPSQKHHLSAAWHPLDEARPLPSPVPAAWTHGLSGLPVWASHVLLSPSLHRQSSFKVDTCLQPWRAGSIWLAAHPEYGFHLPDFCKVRTSK